MKTMFALLLVLGTVLFLSGCDTPDIRGDSLNVSGGSAPAAAPGASR
ncbi:MAG TPA: hypothetical protein VGM54_25815 [Chthoniobacter sp.]